MLAHPSIEPLTALVESLKAAWRAGTAPDAPGVVREHPDLLRHRSLVVDLAYEEYCVREEAGGAPEPEAFCARFPAFRSQIREVIRGHCLIAEHPELLDASLPWPLPGEEFERLTVVRELGRGAFARAYLARDPDAGDRLVVLKLAPGPSREARTLGPITHPHIVTVLWAQHACGFDAVCMPFVGATTLRDAVEAAFAPVRDPADPDAPPRAGTRAYFGWAAAIAARMAGAIDHLHRNTKIAHGDLKPTNVILGPGAHPYLIDFNLSTGTTDNPARCGGTLPYMPPERLRPLAGGPPEPTSSTAADVYSFGVVLFEVLTGRVPVEPANAPAEEAAADLLRRRPARPTRRTGIPAALAAIVERCLDPDPTRRPTAARVKEDLERYLGRRARVRRWAGVFALAAVAGLAAVALRPPVERPGPPPTEPAAPVVAAPEPTTADEFFARGHIHLKAGRIAAAVADFDAADRLKPSGPTAAHLAYGQSLAGQHRVATGLYERAVRQHRFAPPWVRNNLAYSLILSGPTPTKLRTARAEAQAALDASADLTAARLNRAYAQFRLGLAEGRLDQADPAALADVESVMATPPRSADLYVKAALMTVAFGGERADCHARAVGYLEEAVRLGRPPAAFVADPVLRRLTGRADYRRVLELTAGPATVSPTDPHLAHPPLD